MLPLRTLAAFALLVPGSLLTAQSPAAPGDSSLFAAREAVWRDYFSAGPGLAEALPDDFMAIVTGDTVWRGRAATLAGAKESAASGARLTALRFPRNVLQRHGNVAVIHSRYEAVLANGSESKTMRGQITEVFVWNGKRWMHPSWHMDWN